jgi:hypothetical protein
MDFPVGMGRDDCVWFFDGLDEKLFWDSILFHTVEHVLNDIQFHLHTIDRKWVKNREYFWKSRAETPIVLLNTSIQG